LRSANPRPLFFIFQGLFLLLFAWVLLRERHTDPYATSSADESRPPSAAVAGSVLPLVVLAICAVGVESSLSGWLTTYSHRADPEHAGGAALTTSLFWLGIMVSRLTFSTSLLAIIGRQRVLRATLFGVAGSVALLIAVHSPVLIHVASGLSGLCIGPLYPLLLSFLLERSPRGWIFAVAGMGSAFFPWLTGLLSAHMGGLRYGLIAPCGAALLMVLLLSVSLRPAPPSIPGVPSHS
jgi:fucose permease